MIIIIIIIIITILNTIYSQKKSPSFVSGRQKVDGSIDYPRPRIYSIVGDIMSLISENKLLPIRPTSGIHHSRCEWQQVPGTAPESALWQPSWQVQECRELNAVQDVTEMMQSLKAEPLQSRLWWDVENCT